MNNDYPNSDSPWTFYFNGVALPKWTAQWHICGLQDIMIDVAERWDEEFNAYKEVWNLQCRLDHLGVAESAEPLLFRFCAQEVLHVLVLHRERVFRAIAAHMEEREDPAALVYENLLAGTVRMIELCHADGMAFWTNGYEADREELAERIRRFRLPPDDPDHAEAPHVRSYRSTMIIRIDCRLAELRRLAQSGRLNKQFRTVLHQLPAKPANPSLSWQS